MSGFAKAQVSGGRPPRKDILASLKMAQLEISKPALPVEILASILDYLSPTDLIRVARASRLMREMVYEDSRWVQRLKRIGCWDDLEARKLAEQSNPYLHGQLSMAVPTVHVQVPLSSTSLKENTAGGIAITNATKTRPSAFSGVEHITEPGSNKFIDPKGAAALSVLSRVRSIRGKAREEYGKIHAVLYPFYNDIDKTGGSMDSMVFRVYDTPEDQAQMLSSLQAFAKCDTAISGEARKDKVSRAVSLFEKAALQEFKSGYEQGDIDGQMRKYARVLTTLNGGGAAMDYFFEHNHLFARKRDFGSPSDCVDNDTNAVKLGHSQAFLTRLNVAYNEELAIIDMCFSTPTKISTLFLDKVEKDILTPYFTALFTDLRSRNVESYLRAVSGTFVQTLHFTQELRKPVQNSGDDFVEAANRIVKTIFEPCLDQYLTDELNHFRKHCEVVVSEWDRQLSEQAASTESFYMANVNRQADKKDFLTSFKKVLMAPVNILPNFSSMMSNDSKADNAEKDAQLHDPTYIPNPKFATPVSIPSTPSTPSNDLPTTELAAKAAILNSRLEGIRSLFSIEVALDLVHVAKVSLERAAQFLKLGGKSGNDAKLQCESIFVSLLHILGHRHVIAGFDKAVDHLSQYRPRYEEKHDGKGVEPLVTFLELVNVGDLILQMMDVFYEQELVAAKLTDRSDFLDPAVKEKKKFEQMLDERVAAGLNKGIDVLMDEVDYLLATKQPATDFNPEADPTRRNTSDVGPSEAAKAVVEVISSHTRMLVGSTDKSTLEVFNQEIGLRLFASLCKHLKMQRIAVEGSIKLISDMNHYFNLIKTMKNDQLLQYFIALRELSQVYLIDPSDSKEMAIIIADGDRFQGIFRAEEVYEFATRRADWYQVKKSVEGAMFGIGCFVM
ncbi:F-box domain-containing protein [Histoplasma capsulatum G186AR]|uniref:F-box domain-containing protein n=2 Tax=Ajellomyces capsulatus TaxID=5037 RepID=C0NQE0_AJECG|nr:F-box domain-containing protein [Histoplasma capsulatum G186AR]EEH06412.1 F-box domain-containing protein [Histoplasma capsulatum G186AR]KAG5293124.1 F-box domain-containing protein [Histoplasma capsulatum]QSS74575.1 F-box domain-containing protein [Histoplasma capsulatum G186AR]